MIQPFEDKLIKKMFCHMVCHPTVMMQGFQIVLKFLPMWIQQLLIQKNFRNQVL